MNYSKRISEVIARRNQGVRGRPYTKDELEVVIGYLEGDLSIAEVSKILKVRAPYSRIAGGARVLSNSGVYEFKYSKFELLGLNKKS